MFSQFDIVRYTEGDCFSLALHIHEKLKDSQIYVIINSKNEKNHAMIYHECYYFDICGKYESQEHILRIWANNDKLDGGDNLGNVHSSRVELIEKSELEEEINKYYSEREQIEIENFVDQNLEKFLSQPLVLEFPKISPDTDHFYNVSEIMDAILKGTFDLSKFCPDLIQK